MAGYTLIAKYPDFGSQLVSLNETPQLTQAWLSGKAMGLLDDPNSVSAYQIPQSALRRSGLFDSVDITYFRSYRQMYRALFEGRVDVIAALLSEEGPTSRLQLPPGLVLEETIPGPGWYLLSEMVGDPVHCELLDTLRELSSAAQVDFFRDLIVVRPCDAT